jgi:hypothetical protein
VASRSSSKKGLLAGYLESRRPAAIGEAEWRELASLLAPVSESYLRSLLHDTGIPVAQPYDGARLKSLNELESSLIAMQREYARTLAEGDAMRARECRRAVIDAKDRARLVSRNPKVDPAKRAEKAEMVEWMLVWLENPEIFESWVELRKRMIIASEQSRNV